MPFTEAQQWALVIAPKITGSISLLFSGLVIWTVCMCPHKRSKTYHRILVGISCVDVSSSFWLGLSTWPIPEETGIIWASGTTVSCTVQGFFTQFGVASSFYNASLSVFYLLVIRYGWKEDRIRKIEPFLHTLPILWGLGTAIAGLPLTIFNSANLWCWIASSGERGANSDLYRWVFFYGPLWTMIMIVTINVMLIFRHVRKLERNLERHSFRRSSRLTLPGPAPECCGNNGSGVEFKGGDDEDMDLSFEEFSIPLEGGDDGEIIEGDQEDPTAPKQYTIPAGASETDARDEQDTTTPEQSTIPADVSDETERKYNRMMASIPAPPRPTSSSSRKTGLLAAISFRNSTTTSRYPSRNSTLNGYSSRNSTMSATSFRNSITNKFRSSSSNELSGTRRRSREVANQSLRYAGSFYFTWIALTLTRLLQAINGKTYFPILFIAAATTPLQGLPNFLVYLYPRYQRAKRDAPDGGVMAWLKGSVAPEAQQNASRHQSRSHIAGPQISAD